MTERIDQKNRNAIKEGVQKMTKKSDSIRSQWQVNDHKVKVKISKWSKFLKRNQRKKSKINENQFERIRNQWPTKF